MFVNELSSFFLREINYVTCVKVGFAIGFWGINLCTTSVSKILANLIFRGVYSIGISKHFFAFMKSECI